MVHLAEFTEKELLLLETWKKLIKQGEREDLDKKASVLLNIAEVTVRTRKSRMRSKFETVLAFTKLYRSYQQHFMQKTGGKFNPLSRSGRGRKSS